MKWAASSPSARCRGEAAPAPQQLTPCRRTPTRGRSQPSASFSALAFNALLTLLWLTSFVTGRGTMVFSEYRITAQSLRNVALGVLFLYVAWGPRLVGDVDPVGTGRAHDVRSITQFALRTPGPTPAQPPPAVQRDTNPFPSRPNRCEQRRLPRCQGSRQRTSPGNL
jgi:hypothetical protein